MVSELITIIVPIYNKKKQLTNCINSILQQTYSDLEILLIDDGSSDGSQFICDEYVKKDNRVKAYHICNGGVGNARNFGIKQSTGKYIQFVDADDFISVDMTERLYKAIRTEKSQMSFCGYNQVVSGKNVGRVTVNRNCILTDIDYIGIINKYHLDPLCGSPCNRLISKELIDENNISFDTEATFAEDFRFVLDCVQASKTIACISDCLYYYNLDITSSLSKVTKADVNDSWRQQIEFLIYFSSICLEKNYDVYYSNLIHTLYFGMLNSNMLYRVRITPRRDWKVISEWYEKNLFPKFDFDMEKVNIVYQNHPNDINNRKRIILTLLDKIMLYLAKRERSSMGICMLALICSFVR